MSSPVEGGADVGVADGMEAAGVSVGVAGVGVAAPGGEVEGVCEADSPGAAELEQDARRINAAVAMIVRICRSLRPDDCGRTAVAVILASLGTVVALAPVLV